jgi:hypothetical protein
MHRSRKEHLMSSPKVEVGTLIEDHCTKCKEVQNHFATVVAEGEVKRVQCLVCESEHRYRAKSQRAESGGGKGSGGSGSEPTTKARRAPVKRAAKWDVLVNAASGAAPRPYSSSESYAAGELIVHPSWDVGAITQVEGQKMEVVFRSGVKRLLCNHSS